MKQAYSFLLLFLLFNFSTKGQDPKDLTFMLTGWGTFGWSVEVIEGEGYIISGHTEYPGFNKNLLTNTNLYGDTTWKKVFRTAFVPSAGAVQEGPKQVKKEGPQYLPDGAIGLSRGPNGQEILWQKAGPSFAPHGRDVELTSDGGYVIFGTLNKGLSNYFHLLKLDAKGDTVWSKSFGTDGFSNEGMGVTETRDKGFIITGSTHELGTDRFELAINKLNSEGELQWKRVYGSTKFEIGSDVKSTSDGGYIITGQATRLIDGEERERMILLKVDVAGRKIWSRTYGRGRFSEGSSVQQTTDGGYIVAGLASLDDSKYPEGHNICLYVVKTNYKGLKMWDKVFPQTGSDERMHVQQTPDGGYMIKGKLRPILHVLKTKPEGDLIWETDIDMANYLKTEPNPYVDRVKITYPLKIQAQVELSIYSAGGIFVGRLIKEIQEPGEYSYDFSAEDFGYGHGTYLVKLKIGDQSFTSKIVQLNPDNPSSKGG